MTSTRMALVWSFLERYMNLVLGLAASMIVARLLTPAEIGLFSLCSAAMIVASTVRDFGVGEYLIQEKDLNEARIKNAFAVSLTTAWLIGGMVFIGRKALSEYYNEPRISTLLAILSLNFLILPFASPAYALLNRELAFRKMFFIQLATTLVQTLISIALAIAGFGASSLAWASVSGIASQVLIVTALRPRSSFMMPSFKGASRVFRFGAIQVSARVIETIASNAHEFIIARQFGFAQVGIFSRAKGLVDMFHNNVTLAILRVAVPAMATAHRADQSLIEVFARGTAIFTSFSWPFFTLLAFAAPEIILVMFGPQWDHAGHIAGLLALAMLPTSLFSMGPAVLSAMGRVEQRLRISAKWIPIHLLGLAVASLISLEAVAATWFITNCAIAFFYGTTVRTLLGTKLRVLYAPTLSSIPVALAVMAGEFAAIHFARAARYPAWAAVLLTGGAGALAWLASVHFFQHPVALEIGRLKGKLFAFISIPKRR